MRILLLSMPDSFEHTPALTMRMPNGALASLAGNVDRHHQVAVADLVLVQKTVRRTVERLMREHDPEVVGLSVMTFQRRTSLAIARLIRDIKPDVRVVAGGYDPSLAPDAYETPGAGIDFLVRGEGDLTFRDLVSALERGDAGRAAHAIPGLSIHDGRRFRHNPPRRVSHLDDGGIELPNRAARVLERLHVPRPPDRHRRDVARLHVRLQLLFDHRDARPQLPHVRLRARARRHQRRARARGAGPIFLVDDNIMLNVARFEALCRAIVEAGLNDIHYIVQAMTSSIANHGETLAPLMRSAGFRYVFLGIENVIEEDLAFLRASAKNARREGGRRTGNATLRAIELLHRDGFVRRRRHHRRQSGRHARSRSRPTWRSRGATWTGPTSSTRRPIPGTPMTKDFRERDLIVSRSRGGIRRDDGGRADRAPDGGRDRVHALARGAVDEGAAPAVGAAVLSPVRAAARAGDVRAHVPRQHLALGARPRGLACGVRALQGDPPRGAGVSGACGLRSRVSSGLGS